MTTTAPVSMSGRFRTEQTARRDYRCDGIPCKRPGQVIGHGRRYSKLTYAPWSEAVREYGARPGIAFRFHPECLEGHR
jgi:hypothetical protein